MSTTVKLKFLSVAILILKRLRNFPNTFSAVVDLFKQELTEESNKYPSLLNHAYQHIFKAIDLIKEYRLDKKNSIIDISAADGYVSSLIAEQLPESKIYAFEPIRETYKELCDVADRYNNIILI